MDKVTLSTVLVDQIWQHWCIIRENMFDIELFNYYQSQGFDLHYDHETHAYTLPRNQLAFFLLKYGS